MNCYRIQLACLRRCEHKNRWARENGNSGSVKKRKSIRGYLSKPVPKEVLQQIVSSVMQAPSAMNSQRWELFVVGGEVLDNIRKGNVDALTSGTSPKSESTVSEQFKEVYKRRQVDLVHADEYYQGRQSRSV